MAATSLPADTLLPTGPERWLWVQLLHGLHLYGAFGIAAFGWAVCQLLDWSAQSWWSLWFCAALLIYNADRLTPDSADEFNVPLRRAALLRLRSLSLTVALGSGLILLLRPLLARDWVTLSAVVGGGAFCLNYSIPVFGFRLKSVPGLKTFFAPSLVMLAILGLPWLHGGVMESGRYFVILVLVCWMFLLFNMMLCDLRDVRGDRSTAVRSLPVLLGAPRSRAFLIGLGIFIESLAVLGWLSSLDRHRQEWLLLSLFTPLYLGALIVALRQPRSEAFYEWWVEGMLFLPGLACALPELAHRL